MSYNQVSGKNDLTMVSAIKSSSLGPKSPKSARPKRLSKLWWNNTAIVKLTASNLSKIRMLWAKTLAGFQVCECLMYLANNHLESNESFNGILHLSIPYKKKKVQASLCSLQNLNSNLLVLSNTFVVQFLIEEHSCIGILVFLPNPEPVEMFTVCQVVYPLTFIFCYKRCYFKRGQFLVFSPELPPCVRAFFQ